MEADSVIEKVLAAEGECLVLCKWVMKQMRKKLTRPRLSNWAENEVKQSKEMELEKLEADSLAPQGMTVVVVGNTGQGKSTMLNSLIGERNVLPTNGMRACTAALVELTYLRREREDQVAYVGEVEFISVESWEQELDVLFEKLTQQDGRAILNLNNSELAGYESWCKVMAVYGTSYSHSRIREGRTYVPPLVSELRRKLKHERAITRLLGTTQRIEAPDAATFRRKIQRYVDSSNDPNEQSFWPIIKMVRMKSSNWKVLKTGAKLVDAPGLRDDNMARNNMVQNYFKEADSIWIVSDIKRAVNDKTAKDMLGESFRRQMLMDGQFGSMIFIATQSDNLLRSEIAKNLDLGEDTALDACARKRNEFTKQRIQEDFLDGLEDMERNSSGSQRSREELRQRFHLPVFTVSGIDFQKLSGVRKGDGGPKVWRSPEDTEIPALRRYVHGAALQMRRVAMRKKAEAVEQFCDSMCVLLADDGAASKATRDRAKQAFHEAVNKRAAAAVIENVQHFRKAVDGFFGSAIGDQLTLGANSATNEVMNKVRSWGLKPGEGGMYWSTYKASLRRDGVWNRNMNEEMAEPVYRAVATQWEEIMTRNLQAEFDLIQRNGERLVESTHAEFREKLVQLNLVEAASRFDGLAKSIKQRCVSNIRNAVDAAKNAGRSQQREVSRAITPAIQEQMRPAYASGMEPSGPGSHACRKQIVESYVDKRRGQMFHLAVKPVTAGLNEMKETIVTAVEQGFKSLATEMKVGCSPLWSTTNAAMVEVRAELGPEVRSIKNEATKALWKLMRAQGLEVTEPDVNDDDIEDVTAAARVAVEEVDLTAEGASMPEADPVPFLTKVKQERPHAAT